MQIRFHLDENVNGAVAHGLRLQGIDVTTTRDADLIGAIDEEHLAFATAENRVIVTHDDDFLKLARRSPSHPGIVYSHPRNCSIGRLVHGLVALWRNRTQEAMQGQVEFL
jgi:predicted nuclease of predicted toxin-antitoxin system